MSDLTVQKQLTIRFIFIGAALLLIGRAAHLQLFDKNLRQRADSAAIDQFSIYPARGLIYDRNDSLLVYNMPMYDLLVTVNQMDPGMDTLKFCALLGIDRNFFEAALDKDWSSGRYSPSLPFIFMSKIPVKRFAPIQESLYEFPGFVAQLRNARDYPNKSGSHVLGYIREVNKAEVEKPEYALGDYIGANGIEKSYERQLRGQKGTRYVLKDNLGREIGEYKGVNPNKKSESGKHLLTTLDINLQAYGEELLKNKIGSIVAIEPKTGEILALVSSPTYDPTLMTISNRRESFRLLQEDEDKPLFNRATMAQYPPGSLFKPIVALIALQKGVLHPDRTMNCNGAYYFQGKPLLKCHAHPTCYNVNNAIQYSCNNYFVTVFRSIVDQYGFRNPQIGLDTFNHYLDAFGMGRPLGIDIPGEKAGNYPTSTYFDRWYKEDKWNSIWIRSLGIGQGEFLTTNLQLANMAAIIANRGYYFPPHLVRGFRNDPETIDPYYMERKMVNIDSVHFEPVIDGMWRVVTAGTARRAFVPGLDICGKTGTAENPHGEDHSIFFCFAPKDDPQIAVAVYIENAGFGGTYAAPVASLIIEKYLRDSISPNRLYLEQQMMQANFMKENP